MNTLRSRCPLVEVVLSPTAVQGEAAPQQITEAIDQLNHLVHPDVILVARGGGSLEDLWAFNDARVVRAVAASTAPVISGVGHETDFTLTDFAADVRAPTPTGAAVQAVPDIADLSSMLTSKNQDLMRGMQEHIIKLQNKLESAVHRLESQSPQLRIRQAMQYLDEISIRISNAMRQTLLLQRSRLAAMEDHLQSLDPHAVLRRGYALVQDSAGKILNSIKRVQLGQDVAVRLADGSFHADVKTIKEQDIGKEELNG